MTGALPALSSRPPARRLSLAAMAVMSALMMAAPVAPALARGPDSLADLSEQVIDAVVNISAASTGPANAETRRQIPMPQMPPGTPFEEFFEEFFRRGPGGQQGQGPTPPQQRRGNSLGSGFVVDSAGIVITNNHVIGEANDITVIFNDGTRLKAEILGKDSKVDLAVLRVKPTKPLKAVKFGDSTKMRVGDWVIAIGNPFGLGGSVSAGIISARNRNIDSGPYDDYIQTDAAINKGNSGGPLFNMQGEVIGINTAILSPSGGSIGIGFAVPSAVAAPLASQLQEFGETRRGWLGVRIQQVDDALAEAMKLGRARGALIAGVDDKGPAKPAGLEAGDVIITFDGRDIRDSRDLPRIVASTPVGKDVEVKIIRKGEEMTKTVKLARLEETTAASVAGRPTPPAAIPETKKVLGLETSMLTDDARRRFNLKEGLKGVVVTRVDPNSPAADKRIQPGDVIVEFGEQAVNKPEDIVARVEALKKENKKSAVVVVANAQGETRFVALQLN